MKKIFAAIALAFFSTIGFAQNEETAQKRSCGSVEYLKQQELTDPDITERMGRIEQFTQEWIDNNGDASLKTNSVITIPVVVHIVYNTSTQNISDAQIQSQITALNADYRKLNADFSSVVPSGFQSSAADVGIAFCLASVDPNGATTTGITRSSTSSTSFSTNDYVKYSSKGGYDIWSSSKYLNIWVCKLSNSILGYAQFPGSGSTATDGVVIDYRYFGTQGTATYPFNLGRTVTHEVGHWLNLYHIWGDDGTSCSGTDYVTDTPNQSSESYGCPSYPTYDNCTSSGNGVMYMNYMDYTDDECMAMFSSGQASRMQSLFASGGYRASILSSNGCGSGTTTTPSPTPTPTTTSYCAAKGISTSYEYIQSITFGSLTNSSGNNNGYVDYTSKTISVVPGSAYSVKLQPGFKSKSYTEYWTVWIDYNRDGDFDDSGEKISYGSSKTTLSGTVSISSTATSGTTRMRIAMKYGSYPTSACESFGEGEVEDYTVIIVSSAKMLKVIDGDMISLSLYPNPAKSDVSIVVNNYSSEVQNAVLKMLDAQGRIIYTKEWESVTGELIHTIDVSSMPQGIYFLYLQSGEEIKFQKLLVTH